MREAAIQIGPETGEHETVLQADGGNPLGQRIALGPVAKKNEADIIARRLSAEARRAKDLSGGVHEEMKALFGAEASGGAHDQFRRPRKHAKQLAAADLRRAGRSGPRGWRCG